MSRVDPSALRRIAMDELRLGMFVHGLDGSWWDDNFWRRRFLLDDPEKLARLKRSGIRALTIDLSRGLAPALPQPAVVADPGARPETVEPVGEPCPIMTERARAAATIDRSKAVMRGVLDGVRLGRAVCSAEVAQVVEDISGSVHRNPSALIGLVRLKSKDEYTYLHSVAVCALMVNLARYLGLGEAAAKEMGLAGLLHDVGKMAVPAPILNKPGPLSDDEFAVIRTHPERGARLLRKGDAVPDIAIDVCLHHHEKIDGTGYPAGLKGQEISLAARMGAICDVYDALTSDRIYKNAWSPVEAVTAMRGWQGQFDDQLLFAFQQSIGVYPVGMLVRMRSGMLGIVLPNGRRATRPRIRLFFAVDQGSIIDPCDIVLADHGGDSIVAEEDAATWNVGDWETARAHLLGERHEIDLMRLRHHWFGKPDDPSLVAKESGLRVELWRPSAGRG